MRRREKRKHKSSSTVGLICVALISLCSAVGISHASWNDTLQVTGTISTGNLSVAFVDTPGQCYHKGRPHGNGGGVGHEEGQNKGKGHEHYVTISDDGRSLEFTITDVKIPNEPKGNPDAGPKDVTIMIPYRVANTGSIPAKWESTVGEGDRGGVDVMVTSPGGTLDPGEAGDGLIVITVTDDAAEDTTYPITMGLTFRQWP